MSDNRPAILRFLFPRLTWPFFLRLAIIAAAAWFFFSQICLPARVNGDSMLPTYKTGDFLFCWTPAYHNTLPERGDVVMISYSGQQVMLLKRVVALPGDTVEFHNGKLLLNGGPADEPWTDSAACDWNQPPLTVAENCVYAVGDNRSMPIAEHLHGQVDLADLVGKPLFAR